MKQTEQNTVVDISLTVVRDQMIMNVKIPYKWLVFILTTLILWRIPELWKAVETSLSLFGR